MIYSPVCRLPVTVRGLIMGLCIIRTNSQIIILIVMTVKKVSLTNLGSWSTKRSSTTKRSFVLTTMALVGVAGSLTGVMISMVKILSLKYQVTRGMLGMPY